jgi:hypothetical protein
MALLWDEGALRVAKAIAQVSQASLSREA